MIPQKQTVMEDGKGNCFAACIASIIECSISDVPNFVLEADMHEAARKWLQERGYKISRMYINDKLSRVYFEGFGYCILSGLSPRKNLDGTRRWHAVVGKACGWGIDKVFDPHPDNTFLEDSDDHWVYFIQKEFE